MQSKYFNLDGAMLSYSEREQIANYRAAYSPDNRGTRKHKARRYDEPASLDSDDFQSFEEVLAAIQEIDL